jgi:DNA gyrase/topoisomerase IV subunit A
MLDKKDVQWWTLEAEKHPEAAIDLIRMLADRLAFLDRQNEELRGELIALRRKQRGDPSNDVEALRQRIQALEQALRQGKTGQRLLVYARDRIEVNQPVDNADGIGRELPGDVALLLTEATAKLLIITDESQAFNVSLTDLPVPSDGPAMLGNPRNVAAIIDRAAFERCRFLVLLSRRGYVYSLLVGTVNQVARRQEKLIRNLIPGDPVVTAAPSYNADLVAVSQKGRWTRFPEKAIAGAGSLVMELPKGDELAGIAPLRGETNLTFLSADGKAFVRPSADLTPRKAPGTSVGMPFKGQTMLGVTAADELIILTRRGRLFTVRTAELPYKAHTESGAPLPGLAANDSVLAWFAR